jgi:hypothetical protein
MTSGFPRGELVLVQTKRARDLFVFHPPAIALALARLALYTNAPESLPCALECLPGTGLLVLRSRQFAFDGGALQLELRERIAYTLLFGRGMLDRVTERSRCVDGCEDFSPGGFHVALESLYPTLGGGQFAVGSGHHGGGRLPRFSRA